MTSTTNQVQLSDLIDTDQFEVIRSYLEPAQQRLTRTTKAIQQHNFDLWLQRSADLHAVLEQQPRRINTLYFIRPTTDMVTQAADLQPQRLVLFQPAAWGSLIDLRGYTKLNSVRILMSDTQHSLIDVLLSSSVRSLSTDAELGWHSNLKQLSYLAAESLHPGFSITMPYLKVLKLTDCLPYNLYLPVIKNLIHRPPSPDIPAVHSLALITKPGYPVELGHIPSTVRKLRLGVDIRLTASLPGTVRRLELYQHQWMDINQGSHGIDQGSQDTISQLTQLAIRSHPNDANNTLAAIRLPVKLSSLISLVIEPRLNDDNSLPNAPNLQELEVRCNSKLLDGIVDKYPKLRILRYCTSTTSSSISLLGMYGLEKLDITATDDNSVQLSYIPHTVRQVRLTGAVELEQVPSTSRLYLKSLNTDQLTQLLDCPPSNLEQLILEHVVSLGELQLLLICCPNVRRIELRGSITATIEEQLIIDNNFSVEELVVNDVSQTAKPLLIKLIFRLLGLRVLCIPECMQDNQFNVPVVDADPRVLM